MMPVLEDTAAAVMQTPVENPPGLERKAKDTSTHTRRYYRPELDVLRCLAFFMVFSSHVLPFPHHAVSFVWLYAIQEGISGGVPLFFILTSFLITELLLREQEATGTIHVRAFYVRRILRIWPLYFLALTFAVLLPHLVHSFDDVGRYIAPFLLLSGNWVIVTHGWFHNPMLTPLWSTPVQEQYYLLWPLLVVWLGRSGIVKVVALLLPLAWIMDYALPALHYSRSPDLWCNSLNQFQFFALGSALAVLLHRRPLATAGWVRALLALGAAGLFFLSGTPFHFINDFMPATPLEVLGGYLSLDLACVLVCLAFMGARMPATAKPLIYLGKISFGMYIFHYPILSITAAAVKHILPLKPGAQIALTYVLTGLLSAGIASLSYRYFETPFLRLKSRFTFIRSRPA